MASLRTDAEGLLRCAGVSVGRMAHAPLPIVVSSVAVDTDVFEWVGLNRTPLHSVLRRDGAILFRGFAIFTVESFRRLADLFIERYMEYSFALTPRRKIADTVVTSTGFRLTSPSRSTANAPPSRNGP